MQLHVYSMKATYWRHNVNPGASVSLGCQQTCIRLDQLQLMNCFLALNAKYNPAVYEKTDR
jgi:hypothetical protein